MSIEQFKALPFFKSIALDSLEISDQEWAELYGKFEKDGRCRLTMTYFLDNLATIKKLSYTVLSYAMEKSQPLRKVKRPPMLDDELRDLKRFRSNIAPSSQLIIDSKDTLPKPILGVRSTPLDSQNQTPGGRRVRLFIDKKGEPPLYKTETPERKTKQITPSSPTFFKTNKIKRAYPISFIVDKEILLEYKGTKRLRDQRSVMGSSAAEIFRKHGIG